MRTPSLYVGIGVESFSVVVIGLHHRICITIYVIIYSINTLLKTEVLKYASKKGSRK